MAWDDVYRRNFCGRICGRLKSLVRERQIDLAAVSAYPRRIENTATIASGQIIWNRDGVVRTTALRGHFKASGKDCAKRSLQIRPNQSFKDVNGYRVGCG